MRRKTTVLVTVATVLAAGIAVVSMGGLYPLMRATFDSQLAGQLAGLPARSPTRALLAERDGDGSAEAPGSVYCGDRIASVSTHPTEVRTADVYQLGTGTAVGLPRAV